MHLNECMRGANSGISCICAHEPTEDSTRILKESIFNLICQITSELPLTFDSQLDESFLAEPPHLHLTLIAPRVSVSQLGKVGLFIQYNIVLNEIKMDTDTVNNH